MDVTAPRPAAAVPVVPARKEEATATGARLPLVSAPHAASPAPHIATPPVQTAEAITEPRPAPPDPASSTEAPNPSTDAKEPETLPELEPVTEKPAAQHLNDHKPLPVGAIVGAVCLMIGLSAVAILVYLQSQ